MLWCNGRIQKIHLDLDRLQPNRTLYPLNVKCKSMIFLDKIYYFVDKNPSGKYLKISRQKIRMCVVFLFTKLCSYDSIFIFFSIIMTGKIIRPAPAEIEFRNMRFLITDQPQVKKMKILLFIFYPPICKLESMIYIEEAYRCFFIFF